MRMVIPRPALARWSATAGMTILIAACTGGPLAGQAVPRILDQDPALNNLVDPPGYATGSLGTLGRVERVGSGPQAMILIPGLGFGGDVFDGFLGPLERHVTQYRVTLPGMDGTPAPPSPAAGESFGDQAWTRGAVQAIERLMDTEGLDDVILVGHWLGGTQIALRLALAHPDRIARVILPAGSARWVPPIPSAERPDSVPLALRIAGVDGYLAPRWFKTVTRETWDDNNFLPHDYAAHPVLGLRLWRQAARPPLHVWVRYLNEFFAQDATLDLAALTVPTLLLKPGLEDAYVDPDIGNYLAAYLHRSWGAWSNGAGALTARTVPASRIVPWADQPDHVQAAVAEFLELNREHADGGTTGTAWLIRGVRVFDGAAVRARVDVLVEGERIAAVGEDLPVPDDARVVDGRGRTLLPGFIDSHTHTFTAQALEGALRFGVTTVLDQFTMPAMLDQLRADEEGGNAGGRASIRSAGIVATAPGGHPARGMLDIPTLSSPDEAGAFVRDRAREGSQWIKIVWDDGATHGLSLPTLDSVTVAALIDAAHAAGLPAVVHVATEDRAIAALASGADGLVHTVQDAEVSDDFGRRVAATGGFVVPTLTVVRSVSGEPEGAAQLADSGLAGRATASQRNSLEQTVPRRADARSSAAVSMQSVRLLHEAGVPLLAGSDAPNPGTAFGVTMHRELELLVDAGLTPLEALAAATSNPARAFRLDDRGRIAAGYRADLVLVDGDPTRNILLTRRILGVWKAGVAVDGIGR
jgi:imidazolonepropionase-like amidohydrolase